MRDSPYAGNWSSLGIYLPRARFKESLASLFGHRPEDLPDGVASLRVDLFSVTSSLTVLVAGFEWNDTWSYALDRIAHTDYQTALIPIRNGRTVYTPYTRKRLEARRKRRAMQRSLYAWLQEKVPGAFADLGIGSPTLDVITSAWSRPFRDEPTPTIYDYRDALDLERVFQLGTSPALPDWALALPDWPGEDPDVLTLAARTAEVFEPMLDDPFGGGEVSRSRLAYHLQDQAGPLTASWATVRMLERLHADLTATRDTPRSQEESARAFAQRLSRDGTRIFRRGGDADALCADILDRPSEWRAPRMLWGLVFNMTSRFPGRDVTVLRDDFWRQIKEQAQVVRRLEQDQQARYSASAELSGLSFSVRRESQLIVLTVIAVVFALLTIGVGVLQLTNTPTVRLAHSGTRTTR